MTGCGLKDIINFPNLRNLTTLDICDNRLKSGFEPLSKLANLSSLSLAGNPISDFTALLPLISLTCLIELDFYGCPIAEFPDFSKKIFEIFATLEAVNNLDKSGKEIGLSSEDDDCDEDESDLEGFIVKDEDSDENTSETDEDRQESEDTSQSLKRHFQEALDENKKLKTEEPFLFDK
mmetsp:Transcript_4874/g.4754  ORF Transcript_4874/g.4754 Transcript_4874/m.4754 type:complete len:178 (+) Transcript_4874:156-689(+)